MLAIIAALRAAGYQPEEGKHGCGVPLVERRSHKTPSKQTAAWL
jgi:hypothetical protein